MNEKILTILHWLFCFFSIFEIIAITSLIFNAAKKPEKWKTHSVLIFVHFHPWKKSVHVWFDFFPSYLSRKKGTSETFLGFSVASASKKFFLSFSYFGKARTANITWTGLFRSGIAYPSGCVAVSHSVCGSH